MLLTAAYLILLLGQSFKYSAKIPASKDVQFFLDVLFQYQEPQTSMGGYVYTFFLLLFPLEREGLPWEVRSESSARNLRCLLQFAMGTGFLSKRLSVLIFFFRLGNLGDQSM